MFQWTSRLIIGILLGFGSLGWGCADRFINTGLSAQLDLIKLRKQFPELDTPTVRALPWSAGSSEGTFSTGPMESAGNASRTWELGLNAEGQMSLTVICPIDDQMTFLNSVLHGLLSRDTGFRASRTELNDRKTMLYFGEVDFKAPAERAQLIDTLYEIFNNAPCPIKKL